MVFKERLTAPANNKWNVMHDRKYVIMCGGFYEHFEKPKALTVIHGETIIERTLRLLQDAGIDKDQIYISATDDRLRQFGVTVLEHENTYRYEGGKLNGYWLDAFYQDFDSDVKVTYIYGDVVFTPKAIDTIIHCEKDGNILFGTGVARNNQHMNWGEPFAYKVDDYQVFVDGISAVKRLFDQGKTKRHPITWELYRHLNGLDINTQNINDQTYVVIDDGTMDIDAPFISNEANKRVEQWERS